MAVNIQKFLPSAASKGGALSKVSQNISKGSSSLGITESAQKNIGIISVKVVEIDKILKGTLASQKKQLDNQKRQQSSKRREKQEEKLETKPQAEKGSIKMPKLPKLGIFDWIKNFIGNVVLGYFAVRLVDHLPKIIPIVKFLGTATDLVLGLGGDLLNGLITFVDWGYKAYDFTKNQLKNFGGDNFIKVFDAFTGAIDGVVIAALAASFALVDMMGSRDGGGGADIKKGGRPKVTTSGGGSRNPLRQRPKVTFGGGNKALLSSVKPFTKRLPVIGALLDFGLSVALGEPVGRAAFKAIGAGLLGSIGAALGGPFAILTGIAGGMAGDWAGGALYDLFFGGKKSSNRGIAKAAGGGQPSTRGGRTVDGGPSRRIKKSKTKRTVSVQPTPIKPGANVGGEKNIEKVFPKSTDKTKVSPLDYIETSHKKIGEEPFFGPLMNISTKALVGQKASKVDYKNAAQGLSNWMNVTFSDEILRTGALYAAGGGEIDAKLLESKSGDMTDAIAKSLEDNISKRIDGTINDLMKQMMLKQPTKELDKTDPTIDTEEDVPSELTKGQWGPLLDLIAGKESGGNYEAMYPSTTLPGATKMTITEVARRATGAVGKYQQLPQYLVGRAKAAGLNPDKDLYSPENQEKIIINVNIKGRGGEKWLRGEISDEQFMQGLSQEFASLPNSQGKFYYTGQRSAMTPEKVKASLSKVRGGGYSQQELAESQQNMIPGGKSGVIEYITGDRNHSNFELRGHGLPGNYHDHIAFSSIQEKERAKRNLISAGIKIGSELRPGDRGYHGRNLAIDIPGYQWGGSGSIGDKEFVGSKRVRQILGIGNEVPFEKGGKVNGFTRAILGEKGPEFVIDADSTRALEENFPGFLGALNRANYENALKVLRNYTNYEMPSPEVVYIPFPIPSNVEEDYSSQSSGGLAMFAGGESDDPFKTLYQGT